MNVWKKSLVAASLLVGATVLLSACSSDDSSSSSSKGVTVESIKKRGTLKVGVKEDVPNFGYQNPETNKHEGFEIDLAKLVAKKITGSEKNITYTGVTAKTRGPLLDNGEVDMDIATFTITAERKQTYNFTTPYYTDHVGFLVRKADNISSMKELDGKTIGVAQSATTKQSLMAEAKKAGISFKYQEFGSYPELKTALTSKRIDAFSVDKSILSGYVDKNTKILKDGFAPQEYGIATAKKNSALNQELNKYIKAWKADGTLSKLEKKWGLKQE